MEPPRWTITKIGEPTAVTHSFENYIKAAPGTLFRHQGQVAKYAGTIPAYPQHIYDYWRVNRLVTVGVPTLEPAADWNMALMEANADLGRKKQVNMIIVLVKDKPDDWYYALEETWIGGKKNDVVLVVSVDNDMKPQWATVMAWTTNELFKVKLRDDVMNDPVITKDAVMKDLTSNVDQYYVRKPMSDFQYLQSELTPSKTEWIVTLIIALLVGGGLTAFFQVNDAFGDPEDEQNYHYRRREPHRRPRRRFNIRRLFNSRPWEDDDLGPLG
jgi:hypothetical protein